MKRRNPYPELSHQFDTLADYVDFATNGDAGNHGALRIAYLGETHHGRDWYGIGYNAADVMRAYREGWPEGAARIVALSDGLEIAAPVSLRRRRVWADAGDDVDMQRVWAGRVDAAFSRPKRRAGVTRQNVTIVASMQGTMGAQQCAYFWRGAAVLALSNALQDSGYNVGIEYEYHVSTPTEHDLTVAQASPANRQRHRVTVKSPLSPLDVNALAASVACIGFKRVAGFMALCVTANEMRVKQTADDIGSIPAIVGAGEIGGIEAAIPQKTTNDTDGRRMAQEWIKQALATLEQGKAAA